MSLQVYRDFTWSAYYHGKKLNPLTTPLIRDMPTKVTNVQCLSHLFNIIDRGKMCIGNPDESFKVLLPSRKGVFRDSLGMWYIIIMVLSISHFFSLILRYHSCTGWPRLPFSSNNPPCILWATIVKFRPKCALCLLPEVSKLTQIPYESTFEERNKPVLNIHPSIY